MLEGRASDQREHASHVHAGAAHPPRASWSSQDMEEVEEEGEFSHGTWLGRGDDSGGWPTACASCSGCGGSGGEGSGGAAGPAAGAPAAAAGRACAP